MKEHLPTIFICWNIWQAALFTQAGPSALIGIGIVVAFYAALLIVATNPKKAERKEAP